MKKILAFALAMVLCLSGLCAFAAAGRGFSFDLDSFKGTYDLLGASLPDLALTWNDTPDTSNGYDMYVAQIGGGDAYLSAHDAGGLLAFEIDQFCMKDDFLNDLFGFSQDLTMKVVLTGYCVYFCENNDLPEDVMNGAADEMKDLFTVLSDYAISDKNEETLEKAGTLCGYPVNFTIHGMADGSCWMSVVMLDKTGSF